MIFVLNEELTFPDPELAEPDGVLALGGDLSVDRLSLAYQNGIFPWYNDDEIIMWHSPNPRYVIFPEELKVSKSMKQVLRSQKFEVTFNLCFKEVIKNCMLAKRKNQHGTWINNDIIKAYTELHRLGKATSVESWYDGKLAGGLYGVPVGACFVGESMFSKKSNASKVALISLINTEKYELIDCQVYTEHLESMGARPIYRKSYLDFLKKQVF